MQNENNLRPLVGKKKKNKKKDVWSYWANRMLNAKPKPPNFVQHTGIPSQVFQAPHQQQEGMVDLTDDWSPAVPMTETGQSVTVKDEKDGSNVTITPTRQQKWLQFQSSLQKKQDMTAEIKERNLTWSKSNPNEDSEEDEKKTEAGTSEQSGEIRWELNTIDDEKQKSNKPETPTPTAQAPKIVEGLASQITLAVQKQKASVAKNPKTQPKPLFLENPGQKNVPVFQVAGRPAQTQQNLPKLPNPAAERNKMAYFAKGVPRSFLMQQQYIGVNGAIQPQLGEQHKLQQQAPMTPMPLQASQNPMYSMWKPTLTASPMETYGQGSMAPVFVETNINPEEPQQYSPSDTYDDGAKGEQASIAESQGSDSPDDPSSQKRKSAFQRLGPLTQPKKPKLTINLLFNKDESVREVVDATEKEDKYTPVHLRQDIASSTDDIVAKYFAFWPWKRNVIPRKTVTARSSKSVMILEQEQMEEVYEKDNVFLQVSVRGYPASWRKEDVLDVILDCVKGKSFIPCFIEFTAEECKFLVLRNRQGLVAIHKCGFHIRKDDVELKISISQVDIGLKQIDFIPRLVLKKLICRDYDGERKLSLKEFTIKPDISHFIYFPLNRYTNQMEVIQLPSTIAWDYLTDLDLSHNKITSIDGFNLTVNTPRLKNLDLSFNRLEKVTILLRCRELSLRSLKLEGNPLCHDYIDPDHYVRVIKMIFPALTEIDGITIKLSGEMPPIIRNYCPNDESKVVAETFLERYYPFLDLTKEERLRIENLFDEDAVMSVTFNYKLRFKPVFRYFRNLFTKARILLEGKTDAIEGAKAIAKYISKWPATQHDPNTLTVDVIVHNDTTTVIRSNGIMKLTSESLAEDEPLLAFSRIVVLITRDGVEYKIHNEMLYWDLATKEYANTAFQMNTLTTAKPLTLKLEPCSDEELKQFRSRLLDLFMNITELDDKRSEKCMEAKDWDLRAALEYYAKLVKLDDLDSLKT